jgi:GxxExxY protein
MKPNELSHEVIGAAVQVHNHFGPGLLESIYEEALVVELRLRAIGVQRQVEVPLRYKDMELEARLRVDLIVGGQLIVEVKSAEKVLPVHRAQLLSYLRLTGLHLGLLVNFNANRLLEGVQRVVNDL